MMNLSHFGGGKDVDVRVNERLRPESRGARVENLLS